MQKKILENVLDLIGNTPLVQLNQIPSREHATILGKLESHNPGGSIKDRICLSMVKSAEEQGLLQPGSTLVEPTAGNTGIGLSIVGIAKGYRVILTMPENVSVEKRVLLAAFGAEIVLTPESEGMGGSIWEAEEIVRNNPGYYMPNQFENPANPEIHRTTTAREILEATEGKIDAFVTGVGTGGTLTGVGEVLKDHNPAIQVVAVEPSVGPVLSGGTYSPTRIDGLGAGLIPKVLNTAIIDQVLTVSDEDAYQMMKRLAKEEGLLVGMSSGANVYAALKVAKNLDREKVVVTILPDTGERYFSLRQYFE